MRCSSCAVGQVWKIKVTLEEAAPTTSVSRCILPFLLSLSNSLWEIPQISPKSKIIQRPYMNVSTSLYFSLLWMIIYLGNFFYESNMWQNLRLLLISWVILSWFRIKLKMYTTARGFQSRPNFQARGDPRPRKQDLGLAGIEVPVCSQQRHGHQLENFATSPLPRRSQVLWDSY